MNQARNEQESLGVQSGQARLRFESAGETLKRLEGEIAELREQLQARRADEGAVRREGKPVAQRASDGRGAQGLAGVADSRSQLLNGNGSAAAEAGGAAERIDAGGHAGGLH